MHRRRRDGYQRNDYVPGRDITAATPAERSRAGMSLKFQITSVLPELSVYDNVLLALQAQDSMATSALLAFARRAARAGDADAGAVPPRRPR